MHQTSAFQTAQQIRDLHMMHYKDHWVSSNCQSNTTIGQMYGQNRLKYPVVAITLITLTKFIPWSSICKYVITVISFQSPVLQFNPFSICGGLIRIWWFGGWGFFCIPTGITTSLILTCLSSGTTINFTIVPKMITGAMCWTRIILVLVLAALI